MRVKGKWDKRFDTVQHDSGYAGSSTRWEDPACGPSLWTQGTLMGLLREGCQRRAVLCGLHSRPQWDHGGFTFLAFSTTYECHWFSLILPIALSFGDTLKATPVPQPGLSMKVPGAKVHVASERWSWGQEKTHKLCTPRAVWASTAHSPARGRLKCFLFSFAAAGPPGSHWENKL